MIYTFYTDTHQELLDDWFMKTVDDAEKVHVEKFDQECSTGSFMDEGWNKTMIKKVDYILECISNDKPFIHADCDIQFFDKVSDDMSKIMDEKDLDILGQDDGWLGGIKTMCAGFFMCRPSDTMKEVFENVKNMVISGFSGNDQLALNFLLQNNYSDTVRSDLLDEKYYSVWRDTNCGLWSESTQLNIPSSIKMHHANYVTGVDTKIKLMKEIRKIHAK